MLEKIASLILGNINFDNINKVLVIVIIYLVGYITLHNRLTTVEEEVILFNDHIESQEKYLIEKTFKKIINEDNDVKGINIEHSIRYCHKYKNRIEYYVRGEGNLNMCSVITNFIIDKKGIK